MKKVFSFAIALFGLTVSALAQDLTPKANEKGLMGFSDLNGAEVIPCIYDVVYPFENGLAKVKKGDKIGFVDAKGKEVLPLKYNEVKLWKEGVFWVKSGKKVGLVDFNGNILLPVKYTHVSDLNCHGKAWIAQGGFVASDAKNKAKIPLLSMISQSTKPVVGKAKIGIIDCEGNILVTPKYKGLYEFSAKTEKGTPIFGEGTILEVSDYELCDTLKTNCDYLGFSASNYNYSIVNAGLMDGNGTEIIKKKTYVYMMKPSSGMIRTYKYAKKKPAEIGYFNLDTKSSITVQGKSYLSWAKNVDFWTHGDFSKDIAPLNTENGWCFIDKNGNKCSNYFQAIAHSIGLNLWACQTDDGYTFLDETGTEKDLNGVYQDVRFPVTDQEDKCIAVKKDDKWGVISYDGKELLPFEHEAIVAPNHGWVALQQDGKWGIKRIDGTSVVPCSFKDILLNEKKNPNCVWVQEQQDTLWHIYTIATATVDSIGYADVINFVDGYAWVKPKDLFLPRNKITVGLELLSDVKTFGTIIGENGQTYFSEPITLSFFPKVVEIINKHFKKPLTKAQAHKVSLFLTRDKRTYPMNDKIAEDNWDF